MSDAPKVRFKGFDGPWERHTFHELASLKRGLTFSSEDVANPWDGVRVLRSSNVRDDLLCLNEDDIFVREDAVNIGFLGPSDIIITASNGSPDIVGKHALVGDAKERMVHGGFMLAVSSEQPEFVYSLLGSGWFRRFLLRGVEGGDGSIGNLDAKSLEDEEVLVPDRAERREIGWLFATINEYIILQTRKLDLLKRVKALFLRKMFPREGSDTPEMRFKEFRGPWKFWKFGDLVNRVFETSSSCDLPRVEYDDIDSGEGTLNRPMRYLGMTKTGIHFTVNDVLYGRLRPYLHNWLLSTFDGVAVGDFWVLRATRVDSRFLYCLVQSDGFETVANISSGSKMPRADWSLVKSHEFPVPSDISEQRKMGTFFLSLESLIQSQTDMRYSLLRVRDVLLQKMFV